MDKKIWRKNNPQIAKLLREYANIKRTDSEDKEDKLKEIGKKMLSEDIMSQVAWISVRSCRGIKCKDCYLKTICKTKSVGDSAILAAAVIKSTRGQREKND